MVLPEGSVVEWEERFRPKPAEAELWAWPKLSAEALAACRVGAREALYATPEVTNNSSKTGKRPSATRFEARGQNRVCLKGGCAPGILLKPIPPLGPGHQVILARGRPKAIRS